MSRVCKFIPIETILRRKLCSKKSFDAIVRVPTLIFWTWEGSFSCTTLDPRMTWYPSQGNIVILRQLAELPTATQHYFGKGIATSQDRTGCNALSTV